MNQPSIEIVMAAHQHDKDAEWLWKYFSQVMEWVKRMFSVYRKEMAGVPWGLLFNKYKGDSRLASEIEEEVSRLMQDDEVTCKAGIYRYVFERDPRVLSLRTFSDTDKRTALEKQGGKCAICGKPITFETAHGDHKVCWALGGKTVPSNLQMLCLQCNLKKSNQIA